MAISSVGAGSGILTQDILDQLRKADEAQYISPIELSLAHEDDKKQALKIIDANMTNLIDSINALKDPILFSQRTTEVTGSSVEVIASDGTDLQSFSLEVNTLATKQIEQSGEFTTAETIATAGGQINLNIDGLDFKVDYDTTTTLDDLKNSINTAAGAKVDATVVQLSDGKFHLFVSSVDTGVNQNITITDNGDGSGSFLKDTRLTTGMNQIQAGVNSSFNFNGQAIVRESNVVSDLITGLKITLKEQGISDVDISQNSESILEKMGSFIDSYNETMTELNKMTKSSLEAEDRGIFSSESTMLRMKSNLVTMISNTTSGTIYDYGFDLDKNGSLSLDKDAFLEQFENNSVNVKAFFTGGDFTSTDPDTLVTTVTAVTGAFTEFSTLVEGYTKYNAVLDQLKTNITDSISTYEDRKLDAVERLEDKYETMKRRFIAFDLIMSRIKSASSTFVQIADAQSAAQNS